MTEKADDTKRYVLYSPGHGAGWTTWGGETKEQQMFMLEYQPFVDWLLTQPSYAGCIPKNLIERFREDWEKAFPGVKRPYEGGLDSLRVQIVGKGMRVRISEYDGYEHVEVEGNYDHWL